MIARTRPGAADTRMPGAGSSIGYLGPSGTFTHEALLAQADMSRGRPVQMDSMPEVLDATHDGVLNLGFVALENSIGGAVEVSLDGLIFGHELLIQREVIHDIRLCLLAPRGTRLEEVRKIVSFPNALTQCRDFVRREMAPVQEIAASSTAQAAQRLGESRDPATAAVGTAAAGRLYGLDEIATDIQNGGCDNRTRFVLVSRPGWGIAPATGHDKTTIVCFQHVDRPGNLRDVLEPFAARDLNVVKLESRPTKHRLGEYCFLLDVTGHVSDDDVADCLRALSRQLLDVKFLGSYPSADSPVQAAPQPGVSRPPAANRWIASLRQAVRPADDGRSPDPPAPSSGGRALALNLSEMGLP